MFKFIAILLSNFIFSNTIFGQFETNLNKVLSNKDFSEFTVYLENLSINEDKVNWNWEYLRDITKEHQEGVLFFEKSITDKEDRNYGTVNTYKVSLITTDRYIAYYKLEKENGLIVLGINALNYNTIGELKDEIAYDKFKNSFYEIFSTNLDENELFNTEIIYGEGCGLAGVRPEERIRIDELVINNDKGSLLKWLCSTNTEKQIFALDGLNQLKTKGMTLTEQELKMVNFVLNKKGNFLFCSGCLYSKPEIYRIAKLFEF